MKLRIHATAAIATLLFASSSFAQTNFPEIEPNSQKSEATAAGGAGGMVAGDTLSGTSTGTTTTLGSTVAGSVDMFRVKTSAKPIGIYRHRLTLTTAGPVGHTITIRGLNQTGTTGTASTGGSVGTTDTTIQTSSTATTPARFNQWYGFGKQEQIYYRVAGTATTTGSYLATLTTTTVTPTVIAPAFESANPITITTLGLTGADTAIHLFDANLDAIPGASNDDDGPAGYTLESQLIRTLPAGTYFVAVSGFNTAWDKTGPADEDTLSGIMDFPGSLVYSNASTAVKDWDFSITGSNGSVSVTNQVPLGDPYGITWFSFTTGPGATGISSPAPAYDVCGNAVAVASGFIYALPFPGATNDSLASCDTGGASSRDIWCSYTNPFTVSRSLSLNTCSTQFNTTLAVYDACGGNELACNDDCGGAPCGATASCVSGIIVAPGQTVLIRIADGGTTPGATARLTVFGLGVPQANDNCATPTPLSGPGLYPLDNLGATTGTDGQANTSLCQVQVGGPAILFDLWWSYTATLTGTIEVSTCNLIPSGSTQDSKIAVYQGLGCPLPNSAIACDDDAGEAAMTGTVCGTGALTLNSTVQFNATCGTTYLIQIGNYAADNGVISGQFSVAETGTPCSTPFTTSCYGDGSGTLCPCGNAGLTGRGCGNGSFATGAELSITGIASLSADTLVLHGFNGSAFGAGLYFQGSANNSPAGAPFGHGIVCMSGSTPRLEIVNPQDVNGASQTVGIIHNEGGISLPGTYHYQWWYRDNVTVGTCSVAGQAFNFSNAVTLSWVP